MSLPSRPRVAVVFGGRSPEHSISCITAAGVIEALDPTRFDVVPIGITREGRWVTGRVAGAAPELTSGPLPEVADGADVVLGPDPAAATLVVTDPAQPPQQLTSVDVVFPVLHGPNGEDGTLQGLLELADVRYVGSGVLASAAAMDKHAMKVLLSAAGLPVCPWVHLRAGQWDADPDFVRRAVAPLGWPVFVKPARAGSSFGISKVAHADELGPAIALASRYDPRVLVEQAVVGREVECGVLEGRGGAPPDVSVLGEVVVSGSHEFYDFEAKYTDGEALQLVIPAQVPPAVQDAARELAAAAFDALGCEGLARVDFFLTDEGLVLNEVNTMPGFTPSSMFPRVWAASGLPYRALVQRLVRTALERPLGLR
jgi:D-alanine-D-alanine ligase